MKGNKKKTDLVVGEPIKADALEENNVDNTATAAKPVNNKQKPSKQSKGVKANDVKKDNAFVRFFKSIGRKFKEMGSELKKVSWPKFTVALKSTGIVLGIVVIFLAVLMVMDFVLGLGFSGLVFGELPF